MNSHRKNLQTYRSQDRRWAIYHGDGEQVLPTLPRGDATASVIHLSEEGR